MSSDDETPHIQIAAAELPRMVAQAIGALQADPTLYVRGNPPKLVTITREPRRAERAPSPQIAPLEWSTLSERLATVATWSRLVRNVDGTFAKVPAAPDRSVVSTLLTKPEKEWARPLDGITEAPFLRRDGTICQSPGYDTSSATLYEPNAEFLPIPETPTPEDARRALAELREPGVSLSGGAGQGRANRGTPDCARPARDQGTCPGVLFRCDGKGRRKELDRQSRLPDRHGRKHAPAHLAEG